jgi:hypothetical protein
MNVGLACLHWFAHCKHRGSRLAQVVLHFAIYGFLSVIDAYQRVILWTVRNIDQPPIWCSLTARDSALSYARFC